MKTVIELTGREVCEIVEKHFADKLSAEEYNAEVKLETLFGIPVLAKEFRARVLVRK